MSLISAQEARENAEKFSLSADEMLTQVANSISANSKAGNTEIMVGFLAKVVAWVISSLIDYGCYLLVITYNYWPEVHAFSCSYWVYAVCTTIELWEFEMWAFQIKLISLTTFSFAYWCIFERLKTYFHVKAYNKICIF